MAKSTRSKVKRHFRAKKREEGIYAATESARLHRLNSKLKNIMSHDAEGDVVLEDAAREDEAPRDGDEPATETAAENEDAMELDAGAGTENASKRISTHGPRGSRREDWRASKGLEPTPARKGMNKQGGLAARRKAGRSKRRR